MTKNKNMSSYIMGGAVSNTNNKINNKLNVNSDNNFTNANNLKTNTSINTIINNSKIGLKNHPKTYLNSISFTITSTNNSLINSLYPHNQEIKALASKLKKNILNIDENFDFNVIKKNLYINKKNYGNFKNLYIKYKGNNKSRSENIYNRLIIDRVWI